MPKYASKKKKHPILMFFIILLAVLTVAAAAIMFWLGGEISGSNRHISQGVTIEVPKGASTADVANILKENDIIGNTLVFRAYSRFIAESDGSFQYGSFTLVPMEGYAAIIKDLQATVQQEETVTVTIPEGYNAFQIGEALEKAGLCTKDEFIEAANTHSFDVSFWKEISSDPLKLVKLDGFLFPDTYQFFSDEAVDSIILRMLKNFETKALTEENKKLLAESGYSMEEWVIFSSIIQKEAANVEEMYNVASVFTNRMQEGSPYPQLESCTTNNYIKDFMQPALGNNAPGDMLKAYDTYGMAGFPIGAIANPGLDALTAALKPNDTPYYFFVTDIEFTHYYGKTWNEHLNNIEKAKAVNRTYGKNGL
ncbi:MAG: endolytic transglycosylase MltG [Angelakisella sp.]